MNDYTCKICGQPISKRKSLAYKDGRACRHHPEAQNALVERNYAIQTAFDARKADEERKEKERRERNNPLFQEKQARELRDWADTHCWCCGKQGFVGQVFWKRMMIAIKRLELKGIPFNILGDKTKLFAELGLTGQVALMTYPWESRDKFVRRDLEELVQFIGIIQLCKDCAEKSGRTNFNEKFAPKISLEQLKGGMVLSALMEPGIKAEATAELQAEAKLN